MYKDQRFAHHPTFRYFAFNQMRRWQTLKQSTVYISKQGFKNTTVEEFKKHYEKDKKLQKTLMLMTGDIRGMPAYWHKKTGELLDMINGDSGMPTLFFTLSAADLYWLDWHRIALGEIPEEYSMKQRQETLNNNPFLVDYFIQNKVDKFIKGPLKEIFRYIDQWGRGGKFVE